MVEGGEVRRRVAGLERRFLRPARGDLEALARVIGYRGDLPGSVIWARAIEVGKMPRDWGDASERRFRTTARELARFAPDASSESFAGGRLTAEPATARAALLFASDPEGLAAAERLGRAIAERFEIWGAPRVRRVVWRLAGNPIDRVDAGVAPLGALARPLERLRAALFGGARIYPEQPHKHRRFQIVVDTLDAARRREQVLGSPVPASVRLTLPVRELAMPAAWIGRRFADVPDPFEPWLALSGLGYSLWGITDWPAGAVLELAAPLPAAKRPPLDVGSRPRGYLAAVARPIAIAQPDSRTKQHEQTRHRAVWSSTLSGLRLACARGDVGAVRRGLPQLAGDDEPYQPRLIHFAVYGGAEVLAALREFGHGDLEARDLAGHTPLMVAAAMRREGPAGAAAHEIDVPISDLVAAAACEWLLAHGADPDARDALGQTALHVAAIHRRPHATTALIRGGATVDAIDGDGCTPLMRAVGGGQAELLAALLEARADPDTRDAHGWTSLHHLAAGPAPRNPIGLAEWLVARGARPSRDIAGRSPANLCAIQGLTIDDGGPFDPRTAVASGPGSDIEPAPFDVGIAAELIAELVPDHDGFAAGPSSKPGTSDTWQVWADWLQTRGDPRGELVATSLAHARAGSRRRSRIAPALTELERRCSAAIEASLRLADPLAKTRASPIEVRRTHGFMTMARLSGLSLGGRSIESESERVGALFEAARQLLRHEPLLADLRLGVDSPGAWTELLTKLRSLEPAPRVRRLVLARLPSQMPEIVDLERSFPGLRSLWLLGVSKLARGLVRWPGVTSLRLRHGDTFDWTQGGVDLELALPDLEQLDLALPIGMRSIPAEIEGCLMTLGRLDRVRQLRLHPVQPDFAHAIFASPTLARLRTLELIGVRGPTLAVLLRHAASLRRLERLSITVTRSIAEHRGAKLAQLRAELPRVQVFARG